MDDHRETPDDSPTVAIIGLGPKGLYCLERLIAEFAAQPLASGLHVVVFNRSATFGASPIYDPDGPEYLLVNNSVGEIDLWNADDPPVVAGRGPDFTAWYQSEFCPDRPLTGDEYLSRAVVGRYLHQGFERLVSHLPAGLRVSPVVGEVTDIVPAPAGFILRFTGAGAGGRPHELSRVDKILLATGHSHVQPDVEESTYQEFAGRHPGATFVPFVYPVKGLDGIPAGGRVAMKGIGLTFIDAALGLTEGRGGSFERMPDGCLSYRASGNEPRIFPFSRTGLPMAPKPYDLPQVLRSLSFVSPAALTHLRQRSPEGKIDIDRDLWPLLELEMLLQYYRVVMGDGLHRQRLEACAGAGDAGRMRQVIDSFLGSHPQEVPFDYRPVLDPVGTRGFASGADFHSFVERYMEQEIARARLGLTGSGVKAAISIWYEVRTALSPFMAFGGLTPESHGRLMEQYHPLLKRVVFGPPIVNIEKLLALQQAGVLDFSAARSPRVLTDEADRCFELRCDSIPGVAARVDTLVDARYPPVDILRDSTPLYRNLRRRGMVRPFENRSASASAARAASSTYRPGAIDMTEDARFVVDERGAANEDIAVIGIPTEGNLLGNLSVTRDDWAGAWAATVLRQLHRVRAG